MRRLWPAAYEEQRGSIYGRGARGAWGRAALRLHALFAASRLIGALSEHHARRPACRMTHRRAEVGRHSTRAPEHPSTRDRRARERRNAILLVSAAGSVSAGPAGARARGAVIVGDRRTRIIGRAAGLDEPESGASENREHDCTSSNAAARRCDASLNRARRRSGRRHGRLRRRCRLSPALPAEPASRVSGCRRARARRRAR